MRTSDFDYPLPRNLIAQTPMEPRDHSRLLVVDRSTGELEHHRFYEIGQFLKPGDLLVLNDSRVIPARLRGSRLGTGGAIELLLLHRTGKGTWKALVKPRRRLRPGAKFEVDGIEGEVLEDSASGARLIHLSDEGVIQRAGEMPLPPYIDTPLVARERYQTVYARADGSAAAPTAGLHFTPELLESLGRDGIRFARVTLHVGLDTFRPVQSEEPEKHELHTEYFEVGEDAAREINLARDEARRIISVGTTSVRVLEQAAFLSHRDGEVGLKSVSGWADLFILPGHRFQMVDGLITNFHMPRSTLLMMVSAFARRDTSPNSGRDLVMKAYQEAIEQCYRLFSLGDCMLIF
ncbi:MAG: tRNA preQ1(34) S-adenosylmethionine ribosyltransferase-isomerase QueA [Dehalococcoidia bacterium]|jgi:S-adenosylmethionine:tRNA ribosyltransferase-isomerase|nr:tRNA preQ1(34) S-adenosylmethionine ribosyltransferase-isomerase QueA [Dehalococcoidia bacterium]